MLLLKFKPVSFLTYAKSFSESVKKSMQIQCLRSRFQIITCLDTTQIFDVLSCKKFYSANALLSFFFHCNLLNSRQLWKLPLWVNDNYSHQKIRFFSCWFVHSKNQETRSGFHVFVNETSGSNINRYQIWKLRNCN